MTDKAVKDMKNLDDMTEDEMKEFYNKVVGSLRDQIRPLNEAETQIVSQVTLGAITVVPAFRDVIALMRPYYDGTAQTAYTDKWSRVGLGPWFFSLTNPERQAVILHEAMHVLNNHFDRAEFVGTTPHLMNIAGDFEINCSLRTLPQISIDFGIFPDVDPYSYPKNLSMEAYISLLKKDGKDKGDPGESGSGEEDGQKSESGKGDSSQSESDDPAQNSSGKGQNGLGDFSSRGQSPCGTSNPEREEAADDAGIEKASDIETNIAKRNTAARIVDEINKNKQQGYGSDMENFLNITLNLIKPAKVKWQTIFRRVLSKARENMTKGRQDFTYSRPNRRRSDSEFIFPGMVQYVPNFMFGLDTSGSMDQEDYRSSLSEIEGILSSTSRSKNKLSMFCVDTEIGKIQTIKSTKDVDLTGGGGTEMAVAFEYVNNLPKKKKPDVFVLATDGGLSWGPTIAQLEKGKGQYLAIILITDKRGYEGIIPELEKLATVIDISNK